MVAPDASLPLRMTQRERLLRTLEHGQYLRRGFEQGEDVAVEVLEISLHPIGSDGWAAQEFDAASMPAFVGFSTVGGEKRIRGMPMKKTSRTCHVERCFSG